jgi:FtsP/CotA-like multicopper oxidase with cupredoxin domain
MPSRRTRSAALAGGIAASAAIVALAVAANDSDRAGDGSHGKVRRYFIQAEETDWDYAPDRRNRVAGGRLDGEAAVFTARRGDRIGSRYVKALFRGYTDASFSRRLDQGERWRHLGMLGPVIHAEVGDSVEVVLRNRTHRPVSLHPHGLRYGKGSEGAPYADGTSGDDATGDDAVAPGRTRTYRWEVPERAGPADHEGSSTMWMYMSHTDEVADQYAGLIGPIVVTRRGMARPDGSPKDVDRELIAAFMVVDENASPYLPRNVRDLTGRGSGVDTDDEGFVESNLMHAINGYVYGNGPGFQARTGERVRWYLMGMGSEVDLHTPHWHGATATVMGMRTDVASLLPGQMVVADMRPDAAGRWLFHCHVNDHISAGMSSLFDVAGADGDVSGDAAHGHDAGGLSHAAAAG